MSLPFGFSPFDDDYDSPYAHTNAAIRRQSKGNIITTGNTPTSSLSGAQFGQQQQQQQQQSQPSSRPSSAKGSHNELPVRRYSPPPAVPSAEEFGSRRFSKSQSPSTDLRAITQPQPIGPSLAAAWSQDNETNTPQLPEIPSVITTDTPYERAQSPASSSSAAAASPPASPTSQRRKPPPPPAASPAKGKQQSKQQSKAEQKAAAASTAAAAAKSSKEQKQSKAEQKAAAKSPKQSKAEEKAAAAKSQKEQKQQPTSSRWSWMRSAAPAAAAATAAAPVAAKQADTSKQDAPQPAGNTAPMPTTHDLPEPAAPPAPEQVALATPADDLVSSSTTSHQQPPSPEQPAQEMHEIASYPVAPSTSASPASSPRSQKSTHASRRAPAAAALGLGAGATTAAALNSSGAPADTTAASTTNPAHTAYNMGDYSAASPFSEKNDSDDNPRAPLAGGGAASVLPTSNKANNESSRFSNFNSYSAAGAGAGAGSGGALSRSWRNHKKAWIIGGIIALIVVIAAAVGGAVGSNSSSSSSGKGTTNGGGNGQDKGTGSGGTGIQADSRLHNSFYGINYVPFQSLAPSCGANLTGVMDDLKMVSQLTTRIRLSGSACNETAMVLDAIERLDVDLTVFPALVVDESTTLTSAAWTNQVDLVIRALTDFGTERIGGVQVGEEFVTRYGSQATLAQYITAFRSALARDSANAGVLVGTAETSSTWSEALAEIVDFVFANNQAWYSGLAIDEAAAWTASYFRDNVVDLVSEAPNNPRAYISETGWPSGAFSTAQATLDESVASVDNLQTYLDTFVCQANRNGTGYFFFEMFDDPDQDNAAGGVGGHWGLFDNQKRLKAITIPNCPHS